MSLAHAIKNARHTAQQITFTDDDGTAVNLTAATMTGKIRSRATGQVRDIDGTLALVTAANGIITWAYGSTDVGTAGEFDVQFIATFGDGLKDKSYITDWAVKDALD